MDAEETRWDKLLNVRTCGRDDARSDQHHYPYEPTPYPVLERLAFSGYIGKQDTLLDYGCGKGRVDFYLSYQTRCHSIGIEYDRRIFDAALRNQNAAVSGARTGFFMKNAGEYIVPEEVNRIYFFNPFSVEILKRVLKRIRESYYEHCRELLLFFIIRPMNIFPV